MTDAIIVAILSLCGTLLGSVAGIIASSKLTNYRLEQLESKVEKHNNIVERFMVIEANETTQWKRLDELKNDVEVLKKEVYANE